jgi:DNA mismatch endonuclease (patch repair protein)
VRESMRANRGRDTSPELAVRRLTHAQGLRYRVNSRPEPTLRRTADMVFRRARVAVFIDGCFWHGCPEHHTVAKSNATYWAEKVTANRARDLDTTAALNKAGWLVVRVWEHEEPAAAARLIGDTVRQALAIRH